MLPVRLGKNVEGAELERILMGSAGEMGLLAESKDAYEEEYYLNSQGNFIKQRKYYQTNIEVRTRSEGNKKDVQVLLLIIDKYKPQQSFSAFNFSQDEVVFWNYLKVVSKKMG